MAICEWCKQEMTDRINVITCTANTEVEFPDGIKLPSIPYGGLQWNAKDFTEEEINKLGEWVNPDYVALLTMFDTAKERMKYWSEKIGTRCHDCNVETGGFHHPGCDNEKCPKCGGQLIGCGCLDDEEENI